MVGLIAGTFQEYLTHFIHHARAMFKHYEPPTSWNQWRIFINETINLESFRNGLASRMQKGVVTGATLIAAQVGLTRQFNSGWSANSGGFEYSYYRKFPTFAAAAILSAPFGIAIDMTQRALDADKTFPKELQKGYKNFLDALKRIPFEEGPYYLFKNTFPYMVKHTFGPFTAFYCYDWVIDKISFAWRLAQIPVLPCIFIAAGFGSYLGAVFTYPFAVTAR